MSISYNIIHQTTDASRQASVLGQVQHNRYEWEQFFLQQQQSQQLLTPADKEIAPQSQPFTLANNNQPVALLAEVNGKSPHPTPHMTHNNQLLLSRTSAGNPQQALHALQTHNNPMQPTSSPLPLVTSDKTKHTHKLPLSSRQTTQKHPQSLIQKNGDTVKIYSNRSILKHGSIAKLTSSIHQLLGRFGLKLGEFIISGKSVYQHSNHIHKGHKK